MAAISSSGVSPTLNPRYKSITTVSNSLPVIIKYPNNNKFSFTKPTIITSSNSKFTRIAAAAVSSAPLFAPGVSKHWIVQMENPENGIATKSQAVDYYVEALTKVMGNEKDAQMCIYDVSWELTSTFCCELDEECAKELAAMPGVVSVQPGESLQSFSMSSDGKTPTKIKTKKLFVTGLSFYTSEKTLREAFEGFGELVEVRIIMDKVSKRSKGYAFIEYSSEEAASAALAEMNGKIINGWMIVVDVAKTNPTKYSKGRPRPNI